MKIMLDCSPRKIAEYSERYNYEFWQLRTPLTNYKLAGVPYGLDNGCFSTFEEAAWNRLVRDAERDMPKFITVPDCVGSAARTLDLYHHFKRKLYGLPAALVLQDGIGDFLIPWDEIAAVFVGGSDQFKVSKEAKDACRVAKMLRKWIHVGRVNCTQRAMFWKDIADSCDGSGMSRFDNRIEAVLYALKNESPQKVLVT